MDKVKIYIETSTKGMGRHNAAAGMYTIEFKLKNDVAVTCQGLLLQENITGEALALETIRGAFKRLTRSCESLVITKCQHILNVAWNHRLPVWEKNGWQRGKGQPLKNRELWQQIHEVMGEHTVSFTDRDPDYRNKEKGHSYEERMQFDIRKAVEAYQKGREYCPAEEYRKEPLENGGWWMLWKQGY